MGRIVSGKGWKGKGELSKKKKGGVAEVYGAEMLVLLRGLETAIGDQNEMQEENRKQSETVIFADNTPSVDPITKEKPGPSQQKSRTSVERATTFLDEKSRASIGVSWVSGQMGREGNDGAD